MGMNTLRQSVCLALIVICVVPPTAAAAPSSGLDALRRYEKTRVYVRTTDVAEVSGILVEVRDGAIVVRTVRGERRIECGEIESVTVRERQTIPGAVAGAAIGLVLAVFTRHLDGRGDRDCAACAVLPAFGAGVGAWKGAKRMREVTVYRRTP
jgi:hypothetical protein